MGHWGVKSYENDAAHDALDAAFDLVHGSLYEDLMDDRNPLTLEEVQAKLVSPETLDAAIDALRAEFGDEPGEWDEFVRLGYAGVVVRHAELRVLIPDDIRRRALGWLEAEDIDWDEPTKRQICREREIGLLRKLGGG